MFKKCVNEISLPTDCCLNYEGMAFDGCNYFFTVKGACEIVEYDCCFSKKRCIRTCRKYSFICYDFKDCCYYATSNREYYKIYKLNDCFEEIDYIYIKPCSECGAVILGISYDCLHDAILIATCNKVLRFYKENENLEILFSDNKIWVTGILSIAPGYIITGTKNKKQCLFLLNECDELTREYIVSNCCTIKNIVLNPCNKNLDYQYSFFVFATKKHTYPYVYEFEIPCCELGFKLSKCNYFICHKKCECKKPHCDRDSCAEVMESVAKVETALSHILNAEGEKLQKVLATTDDIDTILCVNEAVKKTIIHATHLEHALYAKLEALDGCRCDYDLMFNNECDNCCWKNK